MINLNHRHKHSRQMLHHILLLVLTSTLALISNTATAGSMYTELDATVIRVKLNELEYKPYATKLKLGYNFNEYAVEFHYAGGTTDDHIDQYKIKLDNEMGLYFRINFDITPRSRIYLNFGAARTTLLTTDAAVETSTKYDDYSYSFGAEDYFPWVKALNLTIEYSELYKDKDIKIESLNLGVRYTF